MKLATNLMCFWHSKVLAYSWNIGFLEHVLPTHVQAHPSRIQLGSSNAVAPPGERWARPGQGGALLCCCKSTLHPFKLIKLKHGVIFSVS